MTRLALLALILLSFCCSRTTEVRADSHAETAATEQEQAQKDTTETREQAPSTVTVTTTTEVFQPVVDARPEIAAAGGTPVATAEGARAPTQPSVLLRRTTTTRVEQRGAVVVTKASEAKEAVQATQAAKVDSATDHTTATRAGPPWWLYPLIAAAIAAVAFAAWKLRSLVL